MTNNSPIAASALTDLFNTAFRQHIINLLGICVALILSGAAVAGGDYDYAADETVDYQSNAHQTGAEQNHSENPVSVSSSPSIEAASLRQVSPYQAVYQSKVKGITAELQRSLKQTSTGQWQLSNVVNVLFTGFDEQAQFSIENGQVRPTLYHYNNPMSKSRSSELHFDQKLQTVIDKDHLKTPLKLSPSTTDKLSAQLQIRLDMIREGKAYSGKAYSVVDSTKLKTYHTEVVGEEAIKVFAGKFNAIKIKQFRQGKDKHQLIWLAKDHQYLILRLDVIDKGTLRDSLQLKQATIDGNDISR